MIELIISSVIIILIMILFTYFILKNGVKKINDSAKNYFVNKMQSFNYIIEEKEKELEDLRKQIANAKINIKEANLLTQKKNIVVNQDDEQKEYEYIKNYKQKNKPEEPLNYNFSSPHYRESNFFLNYKYLNSKFELNNVEVINEFISNIVVEKETSKRYKILSELRLKFSEDIVYQCLTLENFVQYELIKESIDEEENKIINFQNQFQNPNEFKITDFIEYIDNLIQKYDYIIYVYVGEKNLSYDYINKNIKTLFYRNMSQGIIIRYRGKIYDYSI